MQIVDPNNTDDSVFALVYGGSGTGKTHLLATLGELGYTLVIDPDGGYKTLVSKNVPGVTQQMRDNLVIVSFNKFTDLNQAYKLIEKNDPAEWSKLLSSPDNPVVITKPFKWVCWDTWTEIQWIMLQKLRTNEGLLSGDRGKDIDFRKNIGIQHWGMLTDLNKLAIEQLKAVTKAGTCNQVFTMQEKVDKNEELSTIVKGPAIHGKLTQEMPAYFDIVVRTSCSPAGGYLATTQSKGGWPAKTRTGAGQDYTDPKAKEIFK